MASAAAKGFPERESAPSGAKFFKKIGEFTGIPMPKIGPYGFDLAHCIIWDGQYLIRLDELKNLFAQGGVGIDGEFYYLSDIMSIIGSQITTYAFCRTRESTENETMNDIFRSLGLRSDNHNYVDEPLSILIGEFITAIFTHIGWNDRVFNKTSITIRGVDGKEKTMTYNPTTKKGGVKLYTATEATVIRHILVAIFDRLDLVESKGDMYPIPIIESETIAAPVESTVEVPRILPVRAPRAHVNRPVRIRGPNGSAAAAAAGAGETA